MRWSLKTGLERIPITPLALFKLPPFAAESGQESRGASWKEGQDRAKPQRLPLDQGLVPTQARVLGQGQRYLEAGSGRGELTPH